MELHSLAQIVAAGLAVLARSARDARLQSHAISTHQFFHSRPDLYVYICETCGWVKREGTKEIGGGGEVTPHFRNNDFIYHAASL